MHHHVPRQYHLQQRHRSVQLSSHFTSLQQEQPQLLGSALLERFGVEPLHVALLTSERQLFGVAVLQHHCGVLLQHVPEPDDLHPCQ